MKSISDSPSASNKLSGKKCWDETDRSHGPQQTVTSTRQHLNMISKQKQGRIYNFQWKYQYFKCTIYF